MNKEVKTLAEQLFQAMFRNWRKTRGQYSGRSGFAQPHEQELYDALMKFREKESGK